ncbi:sulfurtransferase [Frigoriglobus tundricola]|uniref:Thiosulfate sulfurtransferase, rhodanese n=1 Tax=Frigoriglobus tundricola TaxID=2774151 RepID=A0A6M5Z0B2_9BACT|nr:rhodanese-like domain-containing protein [Frigoriglobus tundricola]QJW99827.1 Thiosulfate sulfurtransferase, rhodanese [Frigoriglobus tundricola]
MMATMILAVHLAAAEPPANYPAPNLLVDPTDPKLKDFHLLDVRAAAKYAAGHVPGAVRADTAPWSKAVLANTADAAFWKAELAAIGVTPKKPTVVYADDARDAARTWWMLKYAGVPDVRILNGGWKAYTAAQLPTEKVETVAKAPPHDWKPDTARLADKKHVLEQLKAGSACVDARTTGEFTGEKALAKKGGHIPGATHLEWVELLDPKTDKFLPPADLVKLVKDRKIDLDKPAVTYCQGGGRAAVVAFGLELAGAKTVRNYYPSWGEWGNAADTPVESKKK